MAYAIGHRTQAGAREYANALERLVSNGGTIGEVPRSRRTSCPSMYNPYTGYFKVTLMPTEDGEESSNNTVHIIDGLDAEDEFAGWAYYNSTPVHCNKGSVTAKNGFLCLNIDEELKVSYTIEDSIPEITIVRGSNTSSKGTVGKKVLAVISVEDEVIHIRQIFQYDIPEIKVWGECEEEE